MKVLVRILGWTAVIFAVLVTIFLVILPTLLSTSWGLRQAMAEVNQRIGGTIAVEEASLSWVGAQKIKGILVNDTNGKKVVSIESVEVSQGLLSLAIGGFNFSEAKVTELNADIVVDTAGNSNLVSTFQRKGATTPLSKEKSLKSLYVHHANASVSPLQADGTVLITAAGKTREDTLEGDFTIEAVKMKEKKGGLDDLTLKVRINNFPVDIIEQLVSLEYPALKGVIQAALGNTLNITIDENQNDKLSASTWELISPNVKVNFHASIDTNRFTLLQPAHAEMQLTPELFGLLTKNNIAGVPVALKTPSKLNIDIQLLDIPLAQAKLQAQAKELTMVAGFALTNGRIESGLFSQDIIIQGLNGKIIAPEGISKATIEVQGLAGQDRKEGSITIGVKMAIPMVNINSPERLYTKGAFELKGEIATTTPLVINNPFGSGDIAIESFTTTVEGTSLADLDSTVKMNVGALPGKKGLLAQVIGSGTQINISTLAILDPKGSIKLSDIHAKVFGEMLSIEMRGEVSENKITLLSPASVNMTLEPESVQHLIAMGGSTKHGAEMIHSSTLAVTVAPVSAPLTKEGFKQLAISGHLQMDSLAVNVKGDTLVIKDLVMPWEIDGGDNKIKISFSGKTRLGKSDNTREGTFRGKITSKNWMNGVGAMQTKVEATLVDFPSEFIALATDRPEVTALLGRTISADIELAAPLHDGVGQLQVSLHGDGIYVEAAVDIKDRIVLADPNKPAKVEAEFTPARFDSLIMLMGSPKQQSKLVLEGTAKAVLIVDSLNIPVNARADHAIEYWKSALGARLKVDNLILVDRKKGNRTVLDSLAATFSSKDIGDALQIDLNATVRNNEAVNGILTAKGSIQELFNNDATINKEALSLALDVTADNLHVNLLSRLLSPYPTMPEKLEAVLGDPVNGQVDVQLTKMNGPVKAKFSGTNGRFTLDGALTDGVFTLSQPFTVEVTATPMLGKYVLSEVVPFLEGLKSAEDRIKIHIDNNGFRFPIKGFEIGKINIPKAVIETGKMQLAGQGNMRTVLGLLGKDRHDTFTAWLTPVYFHMQNGVLKLERVDLLLDKSYPLAAWGTVDFIKDRVNMVIGIRGTALANAFNIIDLSPDYMLQLPLKGSTSNPSVDKRKAAARISALVAQTQGPQGMLVGTVLEVASGSLTDDPVPGPTTSPLPWDGTETKPKKPSSVQSEIKKGASSLLQGLIK